MSKNQLLELYEELDETNLEEAQPLSKRLFQKREFKKRETEAQLFIRAQEISREFQFTYKAARFEEAWLLDSLFEIAEHKWISDVLRKVKGGKEASVYLCKSGVVCGCAFACGKNLSSAHAAKSKERSAVSHRSRGFGRERQCDHR